MKSAPDCDVTGAAPMTVLLIASLFLIALTKGLMLRLNAVTAQLLLGSVTMEQFKLNATQFNAIFTSMNNGSIVVGSEVEVQNLWKEGSKDEIINISIRVIQILASLGDCHPPHVGIGRLIIGKLVRMRRAVTDSKVALTTPKELGEAALTGEDNKDSKDHKDSNETTDSKDATAKEEGFAACEDKIILFMIIPPDKLDKGGRKRKSAVRKKTNKRRAASLITKSREHHKNSTDNNSGVKCASGFAKVLGIEECQAKRLLNNSSMSLVATLSDTHNACSLITHLADTMKAKVHFVSQVKPVITCEEKSPTPCGGGETHETTAAIKNEPSDLVTKETSDLEATDSKSSRCETRPGPEYIVRWHWYSDNGTYSHNTFFYRDDGCARPLWSRCVKGSYVRRGKSWLMQGSNQLEFFLQEVMIILYSPTIALDMFNRANASCPGVVVGRWTPEVQYVVYRYVEKNGTAAHKDEMEKERVCMEFLQLTLKESTLVRVQRRPPMSYDVWGEREELLLGEPRSKLTLFYDPLVRANQTVDCVPCQQVHKSTLLYPPSLRLKPALPIHLSGEWISTRCEIKHNALFLRRRLRVSAQSWHAEYWFYSDPLCVTPTLLAAAEGVYHEAIDEPEMRIQGAKDFNFVVQRAFLTVFEKGLVDSLQDDGKCGPPGQWQVAVTRDLTPSGGCPALGITLPTVEYELVRIEGDGAGNTLLFLGQSEDRTGPVKKRPTYFQPAMIQCSTAEFPLTHFLNSYNGVEAPRIGKSVYFITLYGIVAFVR